MSMSEDTRSTAVSLWVSGTCPRCGVTTSAPGMRCLDCTGLARRTIGRDESWRDDAACRDLPQDYWYPDQREPTNLAKSICAACPVSAECLQYALDGNEQVGIWGGLSLRQRRALRREASTIQHGTAGAYDNGCRCDECRAGNTARHREYVDRKRAAS